MSHKEEENCDIFNVPTKETSDAVDESSKETASQTTYTTTGVGGGVGIFNTEDFLARANMNEKINSILRSPRPSNGVRQRSVYTTITPTSSRFNANATPFLSQQSGRSSSTLLHSTLTPRDSAANLAIQSARQLNAAHSLGGPAGYTFGTYEPTITSRSTGLPRSVFNSRYAVGATSAAYGFENEMPRMHSNGAAAGTAGTHPTLQFPQPMPPPPFALGRISGSHREYENIITNPSCPTTGPIAMNNGTIQLRLREGVRIDMTLDKAVRVLNQRSMVAIALSRNCANSALIHPNGRVLQNGSKVEIVTYDGMKSNHFVRYAKMWYKGVSFTSESCALIYLVDTAGTRTTTDTFTDLTKDYTLAVFYDDSRHGAKYMSEAADVIRSSTYTCNEDGSEVYDINGFRITQAQDGLVKLTRAHNKCLIRTSPGNGSATLTTPAIHCTGSLGKTSHLFVRRNEKRMHFDGSCFIVRNAGHSAGFNESNLLIVY